MSSKSTLPVMELSLKEDLTFSSISLIHLMTLPFNSPLFLVNWSRFPDILRNKNKTFCHKALPAFARSKRWWCSCDAKHQGHQQHWTNNIVKDNEEKKFIVSHEFFIRRNVFVWKLFFSPVLVESQPHKITTQQKSINRWEVSD